jgi:hypothetical protein
MLRFKTIFLSALFASALATTSVLAGEAYSCTDAGAFDRNNPGTGITLNFTAEGEETVEFPVNLQSGNKVQLRVTSTEYFVSAVADVGGTNPFMPGSFKSDIISDPIELTDSLSLITVVIDPTDGYAEGSVTLYCEGDDGEEEEPGGGGEEPDDALGEMQDMVVHQSSTIATEMITGLVHSSIDAAYAGNAEGANSFMGYTGSVLMVEPAGETGSTVWAGLKYHWTFGDDDQWTGGQLTGVGGVNFRLDENWVVGLFAGQESSGYDREALAQSMTGTGYSLGVSGTYRHENLQFQLLGYGSRLAYELEDAGTTGAIDAWRYVLDGELTATTALSANVDLVSVGGLAVVRERHDAYVDSASAEHEARDYLAGRATAGGRLVYYPTNGGFTLSSGAYVDYWTTEEQANSGLTGRVELGTGIDLGTASTLGLNAGIDSIGGEQLGASVDASLKVGF